MKFLDYVSRDLIRLGLANLKDYTLVFPMHRAGLFMKEAIRSEIIRTEYGYPVLLPQMLTLDELVVDLSGMHTEDELSAVCRIYQLCRKHAGEKFNMSLDVFYGWGRQLLTDFSNIQMLCLSDDANRQLLSLSGNAEELYLTPFSEEERAEFYRVVGRSLEDMQIDCHIREAYLELWGHLPEIFGEFEALQTEEHMGSRGALTSFVSQHFGEESIQRKIRGRKFVFVGFNYLLSGERRIMELLREQAMFYWDDCSDFGANEQAFAHIHENIRQFGQQLDKSADWNVQLPWPERRPVSVFKSASLEAQAQYVGKWLSEIYPAPTAEEPVLSELTEEERRAYRERRMAQLAPMGTTAIVIADEHMLESVIYALPGHISSMVNVTKGYPLRDTRVFADLMALLSDRSLKDCAPEKMLERIEALLARQDKEERRSDDQTWRHQLKQESYYQVRLVINRMRRILKDPALGELIADVKVLRCLMRRHLESVSLPFHGSPLTPIQVIGVLETRLLDFDHLLVLNCEEGTLPARSADQSFIPFYIRKYYGMQTRTEEAEIFAYNFFRLLRRAEDVTLLFTELPSGKKAMSRFLMQVLTSPREFAPRYAVLTEKADVEVPELDVKEADAPGSYLEHFRRRMDRYENLKALNPDDKKLRKPKLTLSPSAINTYQGCHRSFYLKYILGIREAVVPDEMLQPNEIGNIIHGAMEYIYGKISGDRFPYTVTSADIDPYIAGNPAADALISAAIDGGYASANAGYFEHNPAVEPIPANEPFIRAKHPGEEYLIREFILRILRYDAQHTFTLRGMELKRFARITVADEAGQPLTVLAGGDIDRLDEIPTTDDSGNPSTALRILDYKTGSYKSEKVSAASLEDVFAAGGGKDKGYILQTFLYCLGCMNDQSEGEEGGAELDLDDAMPIMPVLLYPSKLRDGKYDPRIKIGKVPVTDFVGQHRDEFLQRITALVQEIMHQEVFEPCEEGMCPIHCPFFCLCGREKKAMF